MKNRIYPLSQHIINQIAAGEVIHRPASVVKELLENAVDADSQQVTLIIRQAGKELIQVIDDGLGMNEQDARICFERHTTSKLTDSSDLFAIHTLGFRGEALASIASVSQTTLITKTARSAIGTQVVIAGNVVKKQVPIQTSQGTQISVSNLFFNVPARRNFLKSDAAEMKHIVDAFQRIALANPTIGFKLVQDDKRVGNKELYHLPPAKVSQRIIHLLGENYKKHLIPCQEENAPLIIKGYIATPDQARKTLTNQFFFLNKRYIKSSYLHHAVKKAFEGIITPDTHPSYVLYLSTSTHTQAGRPPIKVDVNVHPNKTEVRFEDEKFVYSILLSTIKRALAIYQRIPAIDFEQSINHSPFHVPWQPRDKPLVNRKERVYMRLEGEVPTLPPTEIPSTALTAETQATTLESSANLSSPQSPAKGAGLPPFAQPVTNPILCLHQRYLLTSLKSGLLIINLTAAQQRIAYDRYTKRLARETEVSQQLLLPTTLTLQQPELALLAMHQTTFHQLGFRMELKAPDQVTIHGYPPEVHDQNPDQLLEDVIRSYHDYENKGALADKERWVRALAKRMRHNKLPNVTQELLHGIVEQLFACEHPHYTPDGERIWKIIPLDALDQLIL